MAYKQLKLWFDKDLARLLADKILVVNEDFNARNFISNIDGGVAALELKDRVELIADELDDQFDRNYKKGVDVLSQILGPENAEETGMFSNYYWIMPIAKYVEKYGLEEFDISMNMLKAITKRNTSEYAIRPFIERYQSKTLRKMMTWSKDKNKHVRRLASEGGRPRLPWATKLQVFVDDPSPLIPILSHLKDDPSKYVQKSVANCLNDILKDNRAVGVDVIESWMTSSSKERKWIIKHAVRNLHKKGNEWAIQIRKDLSAVSTSGDTTQ